MTRNRLTRALMLLLMAVGLMLATGASCSSEEKKANATADEPSEGQGGAKAPDAPKTDGSKIAADTYPGLNLASFTDEQRSKFVTIAKAELCPCADSTVSLDQCLRKPETQCEIAKYSAVVIATGIKEGKNQTDILDDVAKYIEGIKKTYTFELENTPYRGNPEASVVLVEFADFQCPHCKMVVPIMEEVSKKYGKQIAFYYKHYPLPGHPQAETASQAAMAAHKQGKFWPMHDLIFKNQTALSRAKLKGFAQQLGLNMNKFVEDFESPEVAAMVKKDMAEGKAAQIDGTPSLYINGKRYMGAKDAEAISAYIDNLLAGDKKEEGADKKEDAPTK